MSPCCASLENEDVNNNAKMENQKCIVKENYSAKELNVNEGEKVMKIKELDGWIWVKRELNNDEGWLPLEILKEIKF